MNGRITSEPIVSVTVHLVQSDGTAVRTDLAYGFLFGPKTVLVPDPPKAAGDPWQRLAVHIREEPDPGGGSELLRVVGIGLAALTSDTTRTAAALLALPDPSRHADTLPPRITQDAHVESLRRHPGDLWATYAALGYPIHRPELAIPVEPWWPDSAVSELPEFASALCCWGSCCSQELRFQ
ncbi:hypothetical protein ACFWP2_21025 [Kitasatospora sp. NPDC058444]|uniref:hypothetical protein n=1 Tax=Kitasatospora sp. NPDC058444 TaxID=3346504 RepID=UPI003661623C